MRYLALGVCIDRAIKGKWHINMEERASTEHGKLEWGGVLSVSVLFCLRWLSGVEVET